MILNQLETEILKKLAERHKNDERIQFFVHDKDSKTYKLQFFTYYKIMENNVRCKKNACIRREKR